MTVREHRHRLVAILAADAAGYSRLMAVDESATVLALDAARAVFRQQTEAHDGRVVDTAGDSVLVVFETALGAVSAALAIQQQIDASTAAEPDDRRLRFRIGVHLGDVIEKADGSVYGDGVNIAARLQALAEPGGIAVSESIRSAVKGKVVAEFEDQGEQSVKNIAEPVRAHAVRPAGSLLRAVSGVDVSKPVPGFGGRPAIAVLPFTNLSGDPEQEYFADGLAEDILTRLSMWRWLPVIARNSSFAFKGRAVDVKEVSRALGVRYVLEGSVRKAGKRVRVTGQLIDATTGHHLWAEKYDRVLEDLFAIQDELTEGIAGALESAVSRGETERARHMPPRDPAAWDLCMRGTWHMWRMTREDFAMAMPLLEKAVALDPGLAQAHNSMAALRLLETSFLWSADSSQSLAQALLSARAAIAADPLDSRAYSLLSVALSRSRQHDEALTAGRKGVELNPSSAVGYAALCQRHLYCDAAQPAVEAIEMAMRLSPQDPRMPIWIGLLSVGHYLTRDYAKAAEVAGRCVQQAPHYPSGWRFFANALGQLGKYAEARAALARFLELMPAYTNEQAAAAATGFRDESVFQHSLEGLRKAGWPG